MARTHPRGPSSWSDARRQTEGTLLRALEHVHEHAHDRAHVLMHEHADGPPREVDIGIRNALYAFVDVLVIEGLTPEATVIALKLLLAHPRQAVRLQPAARDRLYELLVSSCIDRYFEKRMAEDQRAAPRHALRVRLSGTSTGLQAESQSEVRA